MDQSEWTGRPRTQAHRAWKEDHEIFDLVSALETSEGWLRFVVQPHLTNYAYRQRDDVLLVVGGLPQCFRDGSQQGVQEEEHTAAVSVAVAGGTDLLIYACPQS